MPQSIRLCPRTEFDGIRLFVEHAVDGSRQFGEWLGDLGLPVFLDSVLEQPFSERRCSLSIDCVRWNSVHSFLTPPLLDATNHTPSLSPLMRLHPGVSEVVAARAATAGSEHGAVGGAEGRPRAVVANKNEGAPRSAQGVPFLFEPDTRVVGAVFGFVGVDELPTVPRDPIPRCRHDRARRRGDLLLGEMLA